MKAKAHAGNRIEQARLHINGAKVALFKDDSSLELIAISLQLAFDNESDEALSSDSNWVLSVNPEKVLAMKVPALTELLKAEVTKRLIVPVSKSLASTSQDFQDAVGQYTAVAIMQSMKHHRGAEPILLQWARGFVESREELSSKLDFSVKQMLIWRQEICSIGANLPFPDQVLTNLRSLVVPNSTIHSYAIGLSLLTFVDGTPIEEEWHGVGLFILALQKMGQDDVAIALGRIWMQIRPTVESKGRQAFLVPDVEVLHSMSPVLAKAGLLRG